MFDARRAGSVVEILLGMIILGILWYIVDGWILAPIERATGQRWGLVSAVKSLEIRNLSKTYFDPYAGTHVTAVHDVSLERAGGRVRLDRRPVRLRQDDDPQHDRRLHAGHGRRDPGRRPDGHRAGARIAASCSSPSRCSRGRRCSRTSPSARRCAASPRPKREEIAREYLALAELSRGGRRATPTSSPAACSSASAWCARSPTSPTCC